MNVDSHMYEANFANTDITSGESNYIDKHSGDRYSIVVGDPFGTDFDGDLTSYSVSCTLALFKVKGLT